jgi:hypothetical protein
MNFEREIKNLNTMKSIQSSGAQRFEKTTKSKFKFTAVHLLLLAFIFVMVFGSLMKIIN